MVENGSAPAPVAADAESHRREPSMPLPLPLHRPLPVSRRPSAADAPTSRRVLLGLAGFAAATAAIRLALPAAAQDDGEGTATADPAPISPSSGAIVSTGRGEVPTFGGQRPGPFNRPPAQPDTLPGVAPTGLRVELIGIDAAIEELEVVAGQMQDPTGPWVVGWYPALGQLGRGNVVMAGHIDYWNVGPSVFYDIAALAPGDPVDVLGDDGQTYGFNVEWVRQVNADDAPLEELVGPTAREALTLITCGGTFDYQNGVYLQRTVVRANRTASAPPPSPTAAPEPTVAPTATPLPPTPNPNPPIVPRATAAPTA
jgi:hypothetical protein